MIFNINDNVKVKLTQHGKDVLKEKHRRFWADVGKQMAWYTPPEEDSEGWSEWQLWQLMGELGDELHMGCKMPFETEIEIVEKYDVVDLPKDLFEI